MLRSEFFECRNSGTDDKVMAGPRRILEEAMRTGTVLKSNELFVAAATIAAHAFTAADGGFRQRDVRFLIELFSNWVERTIDGPVLMIGNTQVQRYLDELVSEGFCRKLSRKTRPKYRLSRLGLIELLQRITPGALYHPAEHFFFLHYFVSNYRPRIEKLIADEGKQFPPSLKIEVEALLDAEELLKQQLRYAEMEVQKQDIRIRDSVNGGRLAVKLYREGLCSEEVAVEIEKKYPYELNSQKPLSELINGLPPDLARWELETGMVKRVEHLWNPSRTMLMSYIQCLKKMLSSV